MRSLLCALAAAPLAAATDVTVSILTCPPSSSSDSTTNAGTVIKGGFTTGCGGEGCPATGALVHAGNVATGESAERRNGKVDTYPFTQDLSGGGPGCFEISTTHSDGWKFCFIEVASPTGTWTWTGGQWVDKPCSGPHTGNLYDHYTGANGATPGICAASFRNCDWTHVNSPPPAVVSADHECAAGNRINLGTPATPAACAELAKTTGCSSQHFMFSHSYGYSWQCRCCEHAGTGDLIQHNLWNVYQYALPTAAPVDAPCTAWVGQHFHGGGDLGGGGHSHQVGPSTSTPISEELHEGHASSLRVTGPPGCQVVLQCTAGPYACTFHSNSYCNNAGHSKGPCLNEPNGWKEVVTVPESGTIQLVMQHNDPHDATITLFPRGMPSGVSGDPFTTDAQGNKVQFFLPLQQEQHLLTCDNMQLYGRAMASGIAGDHQQWFDQFRIVSEGEELLKVQSSKEKVIGDVTDTDIDIVRSNDTSKKNTVEMKALTTMSVDVMKQNMKKTGGVAYNGFEVSVSRDAAKRIGQGFSETVDFAIGNKRLQFTSAAASKFASKADQALYAHIDLSFLNLNTATCKSGILAEIWGLKEKSTATSAMLQPSS